ncbi:MAG TPA: DNA alkylation repair protein [Bryobacteraceae bacterium]|nr:DNA alkylation repair protein [Bryobacteraceae bacterium]
MAAKDFVQAMRVALRELADPARAPLMQAYMKSGMPFLGVPTPLHRRAGTSVIRAYPLDSEEEWREAVLELWRGAQYREERYAAIGLANHTAYRRHHTMRALPIYEEMITSGAWWDYVDFIAGHNIGELLRLYPAKMGKILRRWAACDDIWKRRSAILAQLGFKGDTDLELLYDCIRPSLGSKEFFLRKGIGWALRQYAWTDPDEVIRYVAEHDAELSPLSKREALKNTKVRTV